MIWLWDNVVLRPFKWLWLVITGAPFEGASSTELDDPDDDPGNSVTL